MIVTVVSLVKKSGLEDTLRLDPEYYDPGYINKERELSALNTSTLEDLCLVTDGNHMSISEHFQSTGYRYLRGQDLSEFFIDDENPVYIPENQFKKLKERSGIEHYDVLVSIVGTIGRISFVTDEWEPLTANCKIAILRAKSSDKIDPYFLAIFLSSKYGQFQLERKIRGAVQTGVTIEDLKKVRIPILDEDFRKQVQDITIQAQNAFQESKRLYQEALKELSKEIGIDGSFLQDIFHYISNLSDVQNAGRMDAEYFHPVYEHTKKRLVNKFAAKPIGDVDFIEVTTGQYCEEYVEKPEGKPYVRGTDIKKATIGIEDLVHISPEKQIESKKAREGDVVVTRVGTIGLSATIPKECEGGTLSDNLIRLRFDPEKLNPFYFALFLGSSIGVSLMIRNSRGSVQQRLNQETLKEIVIPFLLYKTQKDLASLVQQSHETTKKAKELLRKAKRIVEEKIESLSSSKL